MNWAQQYLSPVVPVPAGNGMSMSEYKQLKTSRAHAFRQDFVNISQKNIKDCDKMVVN